MDEVTKEALVEITGIDSDFERDFEVMNKIADFEATANEIYAEGVNYDDFMDLLNGLLAELDETCPHLNRVVGLTGQVYGSVKTVDEDGSEGWQPAIFSVQDQIVASLGYGYQRNITTKRWEIGYLFRLDGNAEINNDIPYVTQKNIPTVFGKIDEVQIDYIRPMPEIIKSLHTDVPDVLHDIDEALLNAEDLNDAISRLGDYRISHEVLAHLSSTEANEVLLYIGSLLDLDDTVVPYIAKIKGSYLLEDESGEDVLQLCQAGSGDGGEKEVICFVSGMAISDVRKIMYDKYCIVDDAPGISLRLRVHHDQDSGSCDETITVSLQDIVEISSLRSLVSSD